MKKIKKYLKLMRVHHYIKNLLVLAALACSGKILEVDKLLHGLLGFAAFCAISSVVYIINDIQDKEKDKLHPTKCKRPIASGEISITSAVVTLVILLIIAVICCYFNVHRITSLLLLLYLLLNLAYSYGLKNVPILDITILVSGFLIRVIYGALITDIAVSNWLYLTVISVAFFFAIGKRRNELRAVGSDSRKVLKSYSIGFLDKGMTMCLTLTNVFYALWSMDKTTETFYNSKYMVFTAPIVLLITLKYCLNIEGESDGDPVEVLLHDKILICLCAAYFAFMFVILYIL